MGERSYHGAHKPQARCAIRRAAAHIAASATPQIAVSISSVTVRDGGAGQHDGNRGRQIPCFGRGDLCAALGIKLQMLSFGDVHSFEAGFHLFFNPGGWHNLMKHDAELSISAEPARGTHFEYRAPLPAALGKE